MNLKRASDRYLGGVCGGIAEHLGINPWIIRIVWAFLTLITFMIPGLFVYLILWNTMQSPDE
ncbi:MAG TPA: PspC domain-containing protein [Melioribacteraceae bacterium]|nr:PspC domain-containing protein [Melioribacteraceae bacterium]